MITIHSKYVTHISEVRLYDHPDGVREPYTAIGVVERSDVYVKGAFVEEFTAAFRREPFVTIENDSIDWDRKSIEM